LKCLTGAKVLPWVRLWRLLLISVNKAYCFVSMCNFSVTADVAIQDRHIRPFRTICGQSKKRKKFTLNRDGKAIVGFFFNSTF
jgi:hypothetical protein